MPYLQQPMGVDVCSVIRAENPQGVRPVTNAGCSQKSTCSVSQAVDYSDAVVSRAPSDSFLGHCHSTFQVNHVRHGQAQLCVPVVEGQLPGPFIISPVNHDGLIARIKPARRRRRTRKKCPCPPLTIALVASTQAHPIQPGHGARKSKVRPRAGNGWKGRNKDGRLSSPRKRIPSKNINAHSRVEHRDNVP